MLLEEFRDIDSQKITDMLLFVDDLHILYISQNFQHEEKLNSSLRNEIFLLLNEKMLPTT